MSHSLAREIALRICSSKELERVAFPLIEESVHQALVQVYEWVPLDWTIEKLIEMEGWCRACAEPVMGRDNASEDGVLCRACHEDAEAQAADSRRSTQG